MSRQTKILATIGPSCESEEMIAKMIKAGVNVFRFNFKHNTVDWHNDMIERVNAVASDLKIRVGTLIDLQGPEIRIQLAEEELSVEIGEELLLGSEALESTSKKGFSITHPDIIQHLEEGQRVVVDDGEFEFSVKRKKNRVYLESKSNGIIKQRKTMNVPGADFPFPVLIERDFEGIKLAKKREIDFVALSFVRSAEDVRVLRSELKKNDVKAHIVSKVEAEKALNDLDNIITESDGIMVARGDLGVELPFEQVPYYQKLIIKKCIQQGKYAITATQMLQSMITNPMPTRAEISDVANATYDLSDAVMLSGESASGAYPVRAVEVMRRTIEFNELKFKKDSREKFEYQLEGNPGLLAEAAYDLLNQSQTHQQPIKAFVVFTHTGATARLVSAYRPNIPIYAFTPDKSTADLLTLQYGVKPLVRGKKYKKHMQVTHDHVLAGIEYLKDQKLVKTNDGLIILHGDYWAIEGGSSTVKLVTVS